MSVQPRVERPARRPSTDRPRLTPVPSAERPLRRVPFLFVLAGILGVGMVGLLVLNTTLQSQAFELHRLNRQESLLADQQASLQSTVNDLQAPGALEKRAAALGMRPDPHPAFVKLPQGTIVGDSTPVTDTKLPYWLVKTGADITKEKAEQKKKAEEQRKKAEEQRKKEQQRKKKQEQRKQQEQNKQEQAQQQQNKQQQNKQQDTQDKPHNDDQPGTADTGSGTGDQ